jgi:hypothetical protein
MFILSYLTKVRYEESTTRTKIVKKGERGGLD